MQFLLGLLFPLAALAQGPEVIPLPFPSTKYRIHLTQLDLPRPMQKPLRRHPGFEYQLCLR